MKGILAGRSVLFVLVLIHFVLPFTPVNTHSEPQIIIGSLDLPPSAIPPKMRESEVIVS